MLYDQDFAMYFYCYIVGCEMSMFNFKGLVVTCFRIFKMLYRTQYRTKFYFKGFLSYNYLTELYMLFESSKYLCIIRIQVNNALKCPQDQSTIALDLLVTVSPYV